ncbi:MAG: SRPBCC family protein [Ilumatobacteraceae bacterium]
MISVQRTVHLPHSVSSVFDAVNSPATAPIIDPSVTSWTPDRLPIAVGTRFAIRGHLGSLPIRGTSEVTTWSPPTDPGTAGLAVYRSISPKLARITAIHSFEPEGEGTQYTWRLEFERSVLPSVLIRWLAGRFERAIAAQHSALRAHLAATQPT